MMRQRPWPKLLLRWAATLIILVLVLRFVDLSGLITRLRSIPPSLIALALAVSVLQVVLSAWRWRYTAGRLGVSVPMTLAVREYYLATFLNQVLPGGVVGDVNRAWRHSRVHSRVPARVPGICWRFMRLSLSGCPGSWCCFRWSCSPSLCFGVWVLLAVNRCPSGYP